MGLEDKIRGLVQADSEKRQSATRAEQQQHDEGQVKREKFAEETKQALESIIIPLFQETVRGLKQAGIDATFQREDDDRLKKLIGARLIVQDLDRDGHAPFLRYSTNMAYSVVLVEISSIRAASTLSDPYRSTADYKDWSSVTKDQVESVIEQLIAAYLERR